VQEHRDDRPEIVEVGERVDCLAADSGLYFAVEKQVELALCRDDVGGAAN